MSDPRILQDAGEILFGRYWRRGFEDKFDISNRSLRRMLTGQQDIPPGLVLEIETAIRDQGHKLDATLQNLIDMQDNAS